MAQRRRFENGCVGSDAGAQVRFLPPPHPVFWPRHAAHVAQLDQSAALRRPRPVVRIHSCAPDADCTHHLPRVAQSVDAAASKAVFLPVRVGPWGPQTRLPSAAVAQSGSEYLATNEGVGGSNPSGGAIQCLAAIAQSVERRIEDPGVAGSIPACGTTTPQCTTLHHSASVSRPVVFGEREQRW